MRGSLFLACACVAVGAGVACAASDDDDAPPPGSPETPIVTDGGVDAAPDDDTGPAGPPPCSSAGWCVTALPDADLTLRDIWPVQGRAFAVAESPTLGVKVLAWEDANPGWKYVDDNTQNEVGIGKYVGRIWAPSESEIYYAVSPGYIYHGKRAATPPEAWTWERKRLSSAFAVVPDPALPHPDSRALGVWGTSAGDVYAWYGNTIFHRTSVDGGLPDWIAEHSADDRDSPSEGMFVFSAGGSSKDDIWFGGGRGSDGTFASCPIVIRKTPDGYRRIVDGTVSFDFYAPCGDRAGFLGLGGNGWLTDLQSVGNGHFVALRGMNNFTRITMEGEGAYSTEFTTLVATPSPEPLYSLWAAADDVWLTGMGFLLRGPVSGDAGAFGVSTIARGGAPVSRPMYRVRGTDNHNLWAIGARHALHKTTP